MLSVLGALSRGIQHTGSAVQLSPISTSRTFVMPQTESLYQLDTNHTAFSPSSPW